MDLELILQTIGHVGIIAAVFIESGILLGIVFPGDSLLITAAFLAAQGHLSITVLIIGCTLAAILGDSVGYWTGKFFGPKLFTREESFFFKKSHVTRAENFFKKYGSSAIIIARFVPVVRTLIPILAGIGKMNYRTFLIFNIVGALLWATGLLSLGYIAVTLIPGLKEYIEYIVIAIILLSFVPIVLEFLKARKIKAEN